MYNIKQELKVYGCNKMKRILRVKIDIASGKLTTTFIQDT
jgi:hypothetical protein